uniref:Large ribosomal subunit protein bL32c n=1 Tax=Trachelomonas volvocina TaxID=103340 RepID=A0A0G3VSC1_9EUGL|nr:ribosomal protein L32 [Trachelomonas volvocina]AKL82414.1 ribosomal protein L32 [Trachelomonas volvocina]
MAVPKKKMSKSKRDSRKCYWKKKVNGKALLAISLAKSLSTNNNTSFVLIKQYRSVSLHNNI